jgi:hypothetical protein
MRATIFATIERIIETPFAEDQYESGSVCFATDEDVRADFRLQFSAYDVVNYVYGVLYELHWKENEALKPLSLLKIPYPINATFFWNYSTIGKKYRLKEPLKEMEFIDVSKLNWEIVQQT